MSHKVFSTSFVWGIALFLPVSFRLVSYGDKPIDFILSDFFILVLPLMMLFYSRKLSFLSLFIPFLAVSYYLSSVLFNYLTDTYHLGNLLSFGRFAKQFFLIVCGAIYYRIYGLKGIDSFFYSIFLILIVVFFSDVFNPLFPSGCGYEGRWGGCFLFFDVYGFPNSSASYIALLGAMVMVFYNFGNVSFRLSVVAIFISILLAIFSLSRSAWLLSFMMVIMGFFLSNSLKSVISLYILFPLLVVSGLLFHNVGLYEYALFDGITDKISYYLDGNEITSGRSDIWQKTISLILNKPLFGYGFDYFSNYVDGYDTPHQQYLEILFKSGVFGLFFYFSLFFVFYLKLRNVKFVYIKEKIHIYVSWVIFFPLFINGFFQPIFSYSVVGNIVMFFGGFLLEYVAETKKSYKVE